MPLIRLTKKLQREIGITPAKLAVVQEPLTPFGQWYAHIFFLNQEKQIIFVEPRTLFSFSVDGVSREDLRERLAEIFRKGLGLALYNEGASGDVIAKVLNSCRGRLEFAKTDSKKTVGVLNEFVKDHKFNFLDEGMPLEERNRHIRYMPMRGFTYPYAEKLDLPIAVFAQVIMKQFDLPFTPNYGCPFAKR